MGTKYHTITEDVGLGWPRSYKITGNWNVLHLGNVNVNILHFCDLIYPKHIWQGAPPRHHTCTGSCL